MREIGSEFWNNETIRKKEAGKETWTDEVTLLSGRTAIFEIAKELKALGKTVVAMPEFACESMIEPFIANGISLVFYPVYFEDGRLVYGVDFEKRFDALFIMQYFGYQNEEVFSIIKKVKEKGRLVIEDATHSFFQKKPYSPESDYVAASLRKWCALPGGGMYRKHQEAGGQGLGNLKENRLFLVKRREAAQRKERYLAGDRNIRKKDFLQEFQEAETILDRGYAECGLDRESREELGLIDWEKLRKKRRENAKILIAGLEKVEGIQLMYRQVREEDSPLFVPIWMEKMQRDELREHLIQKQIYCPVHWGESPYIKAGADFIPEKELSLVCDQRYGKKEMEYICESILEWVEGKRQKNKKPEWEEKHGDNDGQGAGHIF